LPFSGGEHSPPFFGLHFTEAPAFFSREKGDEMLPKASMNGKLQ